MPSFRIPPPLRSALSSGSATPRPSPPSRPRTRGCRRSCRSASASSTTGTSRAAPSRSPSSSTSCWGCRRASSRVTSRAGSRASIRTTATRRWPPSPRPYSRAVSSAATTGCSTPTARWLTVSDQGVLLTNRAGRATSMIGALRDVTRERAAQAVQREADELRRVLFRLPSPAMQVDARGAYLDADARALEFFERSRERDAGLVRERRLRPRGRRERSRTVDDAAGSAEAELEVECTVNGRSKHLLLSIIPTRFAGEPGAFLPGNGHQRAEAHAAGAGPVGEGAASPGDHPRRAQHGAQGAAGAARTGAARARGAHRPQRRRPHRADPRPPEPCAVPPPRAARGRCAEGEPPGDRGPLRPPAGAGG